MKLTQAEKLLDDYVSLKSLDNKTYIQPTNYEKLLADYSDFIDSLRNKQRETAPDVNIFDVLNFTNDEVRHSKVLAWLFDHTETHAQGKLFFRCFLESVRLPEAYLDTDYLVATEQAGDNSRIDIRITARNKFIIDIENKVDSSERKQQTIDEYVDALRKAKTMGIDGKNNVKCFYLTPSPKDTKQESQNFEHISWKKEIIGTLNNFIAEARSNNIKWLISQYVEAIEDNILYAEEKEND